MSEALDSESFRTLLLDAPAAARVQAISNKAAAPMPPPVHMVATT
jgi:hypothetical protein